MKAIFAFFLASLTCVLSTPAWDDLRTTFGINPFSKIDFAEQPRDLHQDLQGFTLMDNMCSGTQQFLGQRYWSNNDPALILLFDVNGYIAGIQTAVPKTSGYLPVAPMLGTYILEEKDYFKQTVYFVDPAIVCTTGRSSDDFANQGTGTDLYIQNGPNATTDYFKVPMNEYEIKLTNWGFGKCFFEMGMHYWYNTSANMDCKDFVPYCLLYNGGKLNAFCFAVNYNVQGTQRYEHPTIQNDVAFMEAVPKCFNSPQSTLHVYTTSNYLANLC